MVEHQYLLLFVARESTQEPLGFSPFKLVFGHLPCGSLKLLKESLLNHNNNSSQSVIMYVSDVRERLEGSNWLKAQVLVGSEKLEGFAGSNETMV